jgi:hypothetical protein
LIHEGAARLSRTPPYLEVTAMGDHGRDDGGTNGVNEPGDAHDDDLTSLDFDIPDDIRELDHDVRLYRRQQQWARRRSVVSRMLFIHRWRRYGLSVPLVIAVLLVVTLVGSMLTFLGPHPSPRPGRLPLAQVSAAAGTPGGLLPDVSVNAHGMRVSARELRPAVLALVPLECGCMQTLDELSRQAQEYQLSFYLVGDPTQEQGLRRATAHIGNGTAFVAVDGGHALAEAYRAAGLTVILLHADGVVDEVPHNVHAGARLEFGMAGLSGPGARSPSVGPPAGTPSDPTW